MVHNRQKVKDNPFTFGRNSAILGTFFKVDFPKNCKFNEAQIMLKTLFKP